MADYFVYDQEKLAREYARSKRRFLPVSEVLHIESSPKQCALK